jgi:16S rRNA (guanine527-N7)-methyltransferase
MSDPSAALDAHRTLLARWRAAMDLVGPGPLEPHFADAVGAVSGLAVAGRWADLGSGAGFPGVALAAFHPAAAVELVESREKRALFLEKVVAAAGLVGAQVRRCRTEELADGAYDGVISRAYKPPPAFLEDAARLLRPGGQAVVLLGDEPSWAPPPGWVLRGRSRYAVPDGFRVRAVVVRAGDAAAAAD